MYLTLPKGSSLRDVTGNGPSQNASNAPLRRPSTTSRRPSKSGGGDGYLPNALANRLLSPQESEALKRKTSAMEGLLPANLANNVIPRDRQKPAYSAGDLSESEQSTSSTRSSRRKKRDVAMSSAVGVTPGSLSAFFETSFKQPKTKEDCEERSYFSTKSEKRDVEPGADGEDARRQYKAGGRRGNRRSNRRTSYAQGSKRLESSFRRDDSDEESLVSAGPGEMPGKDSRSRRRMYMSKNRGRNEGSTEQDAQEGQDPLDCGPSPAPSGRRVVSKEMLPASLLGPSRGGRRQSTCGAPSKEYRAMASRGGRRQSTCGAPSVETRPVRSNRRQSTCGAPSRGSQRSLRSERSLGGFIDDRAKEPRSREDRSVASMPAMAQRDGGPSRNHKPSQSNSRRPVEKQERNGRGLLISSQYDDDSEEEPDLFAENHDAWSNDEELFEADSRQQYNRSPQGQPGDYGDDSSCEDHSQYSGSYDSDGSLTETGSVIGDEAVIDTFDAYQWSNEAQDKRATEEERRAMKGNIRRSPLKATTN